MFEGETLLLPKPRKSSVDLKISWAFPNTYAVGMAGLGYQLIWWLLEQDPETQVHRVFADAAEDGWEDCDLLGFTLSWELDYAGVLAILEKGGIAQLSANRDEDSPIVFGGGPSLAANPEPFAGIFDVVLLGDAELMVPTLQKTWREARSFKTRAERLRFLATKSGLYVPSLYTYEVEHEGGPLKAIRPIETGIPETIGKQVFTAPPDYVAHSVILTPEGTWGDMFLVEVARSCPQECRFCLASYLTRPFRAANLPTLLEKVDLGLQHTKRIGLLGPSVTEHPNFDQLAEALTQRPGLEIGLPSVRVDTVTPELLSTLVRLKQKSITLAIESGSERLRAIMKKNLTNQQIFDAATMVAASGLESVKFYGIAGLPGETDEDLQETIKLLTTIKKTHKRLKVVFGMSSFVPKAQTPFQWHGRDRRAGEKMEFIRKHLAPKGIEVRPESHNWSDIQAYLSRADRRVCDLLVDVAANSAKLGAWKKAWKAASTAIPHQDFYIFRDIPYEETLPWSHLVEEAKAVMLRKHDQTARSLAAAPYVIPVAGN